MKILKKGSWLNKPKKHCKWKDHSLFWEINKNYKRNYKRGWIHIYIYIYIILYYTYIIYLLYYIILYYTYIFIYIYIYIYIIFIYYIYIILYVLYYIYYIRLLSKHFCLQMFFLKDSFLKFRSADHLKMFFSWIFLRISEFYGEFQFD